MGLALLVWVGGGEFYTFFDNEPSSGQKSSILDHLAILPPCCQPVY